MRTSPGVFRCFNSGRTLNPKDLFLILVLVTSYCIFETYKSVATKKSGCRRSLAQITRNVIQSEDFRPFENDLTLEYVKFGQFGNDTSWKYSDCKDASCTRVKFINSSKADRTKNLNSTQKSYSSKFTKTPSTPAVASRAKLMSCEQIEKVWRSLNSTTSQTREGVQSRQGNFLIGEKSPWRLLEIKEAQRGTPGFDELYKELKKREKLKWNMYGLVKFHGACVTNQSIRIVQDLPKGLRLCDDVMEKGGNFSHSPCFHLPNLDKAISSHNDKARAAMVFAQSLICFLGEIEERRMFIEDVHGINFVIRDDMTVIYTNLDTAIFYGSRNLNGDSICIHDSECPTPNATLWFNGTANNILYRPCADSKPTCFRNRCIGFNASMHLCGISHWIQGKVYNYMERNKDRKMILFYLKKLARLFAISRASGNHVCRDMYSLISRYDDDLKKLGGGDVVKSGYHVALPPYVTKLSKVKQVS